MSECRICRHTFKALKFKTEHIGICTRCVNSLNGQQAPASLAQARLAEMLARGMSRNAERDLESLENWKRRKAQWTVENFHTALEQALPDWITKLLANPDNSTRDFKIMRAHRRGLLRMDGFADYPSTWPEIARNIRARDGMRCVACGAGDQILDVHHIVYLSRHGTNQQHNLVTLCRPCHEKEHGREFDWHEAKDPESIVPIQPPPGMRAPAPAPAPTPTPTPTPVQAGSSFTLAPNPAPAPSALVVSVSITARTPSAPALPPSHIDLRCPGCATVLTLPALQAVKGQKLRCVQCLYVFVYGITVSESADDESAIQKFPQPPGIPAQSVSSVGSRKPWLYAVLCGT